MFYTWLPQQGSLITEVATKVSLYYNYVQMHLLPRVIQVYIKLIIDKVTYPKRPIPTTSQ